MVRIPNFTWIFLLALILQATRDAVSSFIRTACVYIEDLTLRRINKQKYLPIQCSYTPERA